MTFSSWIKQNIIPLVVLITSLTGVYTSLYATQIKHEEAISRLNTSVDSLNKIVSELPTLKKDVMSNKEAVAELKPIMSELAKGVNALNITLAELKGALDVSNTRIDYIQKSNITTNRSNTPK